MFNQIGFARPCFSLPTHMDSWDSRKKTYLISSIVHRQEVTLTQEVMQFTHPY